MRSQLIKDSAVKGCSRLSRFKVDVNGMSENTAQGEAKKAAHKVATRRLQEILTSRKHLGIYSRVLSGLIGVNCVVASMAESPTIPAVSALIALAGLANEHKVQKENHKEIQKLFDDVAKKG